MTSPLLTPRDIERLRDISNLERRRHSISTAYQRASPERSYRTSCTALSNRGGVSPTDDIKVCEASDNSDEKIRCACELFAAANTQRRRSVHFAGVDFEDYDDDDVKKRSNVELKGVEFNNNKYDNLSNGTPRSNNNGRSKKLSSDNKMDGRKDKASSSSSSGQDLNQPQNDGSTSISPTTGPRRASDHFRIGSSTLASAESVKSTASGAWGRRRNSLPPPFSPLTSLTPLPAAPTSLPAFHRSVTVDEYIEECLARAEDPSRGIRMTPQPRGSDLFERVLEETKAGRINEGGEVEGEEAEGTEENVGGRGSAGAGGQAMFRAKPRLPPRVPGLLQMKGRMGRRQSMF